MNTDPAGRGLFIVDNSVAGWTGLRYLEEWSSIARAYDVATGFLRDRISPCPGWQVARIGENSRTDGCGNKLRVRAGHFSTPYELRAIEALDKSIESDKQDNPFLHGVPAVLEGLRSGQIECRVYDKGKFHAKTYITHAKLEVVGSQALVGSSNFHETWTHGEHRAQRADSKRS